jgi:hypothetical protein
MSLFIYFVVVVLIQYCLSFKHAWHMSTSQNTLFRKFPALKAGAHEIKDILSANMKSAMKLKDSHGLSVVRAIQAAIQLKEIELRGPIK